MSLKILQNDIFGNKQSCEVTKPVVKAAPPKKFPSITMHNGINELQAANDAMLVHRALQKKLTFSGLTTKKQLSSLLKIVENEINLPRGIIDPVTATRDSLIKFYG
jgi:hypothetical protein